jgi:hypothetical protein
MGRRGSCTPARARWTASATTRDGFVLADDARLEVVGQAEDLLTLSFEQLADGHAGPAGDDFGDLLGRDGLLGRVRSADFAAPSSLTTSFSSSGMVAVTELGDFLEPRRRVRPWSIAALASSSCERIGTDLGHGLLIRRPTGAEGSLLLTGGAQLLVGGRRAGSSEASSFSFFRADSLDLELE